MAAYGALVSVMQIIDQLRRHPHPPISLDQTQSQSLTANVDFMQNFLEGYNPFLTYTSEADPLESRIAEAAYAAEDVIESYIVDRIHARSTDQEGKISSTQFYQDLEKVLKEMDLIKMEIQQKMKEIKGVQIIKKQSTAGAASSMPSSTAHKVGMVGLDEVLYELLDKITRGEHARQIIPIVGMGGLGKTTPARNIYAHQLVKEHFDTCAWSTISQVHNSRKILTEILGQVGLDYEVDSSEYELGEKLYRHLFGKRYLIVMDDMWSIEAWDKIRSFFPDNGNGSSVVVTTRLSQLASKFDYSNGLDMKFLDEASCWNIFSKTVFGEGIFPPELKDIGEKIVEGCRGLPLSIVVVGGLLSKSDPTRENWEVVEENLSSVVNAEEDGSCLQSLYMSYNNLPIHLKPCFLYMGVFREDAEIPVFLLIPIMVAEGFIKPIEGRSLEEAGLEYLEELVGRNLVLVDERDSCGMLKSCKIHDLLRDLALREGEKDRFSCMLMQRSNDDRNICHGLLSTQRRMANWSNEEYPLDEVPGFVEEVEGASPLVRSLMGEFPAHSLSLPGCRLLRVCMWAKIKSNDEYDEEILNRLFNLRCLLFDAQISRFLKYPFPKTLSSYLWNLQTLVLLEVEEDYVLDIWKMPLLRHVMTTNGTFSLPNPPTLGGDEVVLENLHTLSTVRNLNLSEEVITRIPNIDILQVEYEEEKEEEEEEAGGGGGGGGGGGEKKGDKYCLSNLHRLNKLQHLHLTRDGWVTSLSMQELMLPYSLKQLILFNTELPWEEMASKIGCLPLLQVLKLKFDAFVGYKWETVEGQFSSLKSLKIKECGVLECWMTDSTHFPRLEHLVLRRLRRLREIPSCIGDIPTLESIKLYGCSVSAEDSARRIQEEQQEYGNEGLQIQVNR